MTHNKKRKSNLQRVLDESGISQNKLAQALGKSQSWVNAVCTRRQRTVLVGTALRICREVHATVEEAFGDHEL